MKTENEPALPAPESKKKPRKDRGTRRVSLPAWLVKDLEALAKEGRHATLEALLVAWARQAAAVLPDRVVTLPPAVQARLAPAAAATGRSVSDLLLDFEGDLCGLLDGSLLYRSASGAEVPVDLLVPGLEERLITAFRARLKAATERSQEPPAQEVVG